MKSNEQYKQAENSEIPDVLLKDYCEQIQYGYTQSASLEEIGPKFLRITDIQNKPINWETVPFCKISYSDLNKYLLSTGDIVIARTGASTGTSAIFDSSKMPKSVFASYLIRLKLTKTFDPWFVYYFLQSRFYGEHIVGILGGSAQPNANAQQLTNVYIKKLNFDEQQQIASILSSLDDMIELNRKMNKTLEEIGRSLFNKYIRLSSARNVQLQDIVEPNPRESLSKSVEARFIEMKDLPEEGMWVSSSATKPYKGGSKFRNGDSLMARITPCLENGKSGFVNSLSEEELAFGSTEFIVLRPKENIYEEFVYFLVRDKEFRNHAIRSMVGSSGRQRVQVDAIRTYKLKIPSDEVIKKFHLLTKEFFEQIKQNSIENEKLSILRDLLLPRLISRKLRVN